MSARPSGPVGKRTCLDVTEGKQIEVNGGQCFRVTREDFFSGRMHAVYMRGVNLPAFLMWETRECCASLASETKHAIGTNENS